MNLQEFNLKTIIKQIISENFNTIEEANKGKNFDGYLELAFSKMTPDVPEDKFGKVNLKKEAYGLLQTKLSKVFQKNFEYKNFYIVKLGKFAIRTNDGKELLAFSKEGETDKKFSYTYLYIYHNTVELIRFGSAFFETDELLLKSAQEFIKNRNINLVTKTETGQILFDNNFESDNTIDLTDYNKAFTPPAAEPKRFGVAFVPKTKYKVGEKILTRAFGPGIITGVKKVAGTEIPTYDVTATFKQGEREVSKTIRMQKKVQGQTA